MLKFKDIVALLRVHQYIKNFFIFLPLFFSAKFFDWKRLLLTCLAFICFSLFASAVYIFNDLRDILEDRKHPKKKNRPIASERVSKSEAYTIFGLLLFLGGMLLALLPVQVMEICFLYVALNMIYSIRLKHVAILDVTVIAVGFVLRLYVGAVTGDIVLSRWIIIITFLLALFLALAKRREDFLLYIADGEKTRLSIEGYNLVFIETAMSIMASVVIVSYILYTVSGEVITRLHTNKLYLTTFFVVLGILRYLQVTFVRKEGGNPTRVLLKDRFLQLTVVGWLLVFGLILYG